MPSLSPDQVRHIAKLARLRLSEEELERFTPELSKILEYVSMLQDVDTTGIEPTAQATGLSHRVRDDVVLPPIASPDALLAASPLPVIEHQIVTSSAHE